VRSTFACATGPAQHYLAPLGFPAGTPKGAVRLRQDGTLRGASGRHDHLAFPLLSSPKRRRPDNSGKEPTGRHQSKCVPVSRVLSSRTDRELHHLSRPTVASRLYLPTRIAGVAGGPPAFRPKAKGNTVWYFNPRGLPPNRITTNRRALLPHVFTLTPAEPGRYSFLWHFPYPSRWKNPGR
jgi:hypothetical protein